MSVCSYLVASTTSTTSRGFPADRHQVLLTCLQLSFALHGLLSLGKLHCIFPKIKRLSVASRFAGVKLPQEMVADAFGDGHVDDRSSVRDIEGCDRNRRTWNIPVSLAIMFRSSGSSEACFSRPDLIMKASYLVFASIRTDTTVP